MKSRWYYAFATLLIGVIALLPARTEGAPEESAYPDKQEFDAVMSKAVDFLKGVQAEDGSYAAKMSGPGITSIVVTGLLRNGKSIDDPMVAKALGFMEKNIKPDGGIYAKGLANYTTCLGVMAFNEANKSGKYTPVVTKANAFLKRLQSTEGDAAGGVGYGGGNNDRPDLSNTHYFVEALIASGVPKDDPALKRALLFVSRCQNLPGESNGLAYAKKTSADDKGGFVYNPLEEPDANNKKATPAGGLRSEGGMTYAGLKSFLYAGVGKDDPRVKAAIEWVRQHYSVTENPGQKDAGLFYYYHTFAKAMDALGEDPFIDAKGNKHYWRKELFEELKKRQNKNGSWTNSNRAFLENLPDLATSFAVLSLSYCRPPK